MKLKPINHQIFIKNLKSLKKMAEKEGISINDLIKMLKSE